jgi:hypothetical protein
MGSMKLPGTWKTLGGHGKIRDLEVEALLVFVVSWPSFLYSILALPFALTLKRAFHGAA